VLFLLMESHFLMMGSFALMLLLYTAGTQLNVIVGDCFKLVFSGKHIDRKSNQILDTTEELRGAVQMKAADAAYRRESFRFQRRNDLTECIEIFISGKRPDLSAEDFLNYLRTNFYSDAHEHYEYNAYCLDFVGNLMPFFGIAGTLYGMLPVLSAMKEGVDISAVSGGLAIAMNSTLYGALFSIFFKVVASRFKQQILALNYQFDEVISQLRFLAGAGEGQRQ
jgi:biopolymer transport protein ExbB/TolQ